MTDLYIMLTKSHCRRAIGSKSTWNRIGTNGTFIRLAARHNANLRSMFNSVRIAENINYNSLTIGTKRNDFTACQRIGQNAHRHFSRTKKARGGKRGPWIGG